MTFKTNSGEWQPRQIAEESGTEVDYVCPDGLTCQPDATTVDIDDGNGDYSASPYLTWTLTALVPKTFTLSKAFVAHYPTGATASDWQLFWSSRSDKCSGATPRPAGALHCLGDALQGRQGDRSCDARDQGPDRPQRRDALLGARRLREGIEAAARRLGQDQITLLLVEREGLPNGRPSLSFVAGEP